MRDVRYRVYLDDGTDEGVDRWENVMELRGVASVATATVGAGLEEGPTLADFLQQVALVAETDNLDNACLLYTSPSPRDRTRSRMPSSA